MTDQADHRPHPYTGGRAAALRELAAWHAGLPSAPKVLLVTGAPGSGRSRLVTGFLMLCDPAQRARIAVDTLDPATVPPPGLPAPLVFPATGLTAAQLLWSVADEFGMEVERSADVRRLLRELPGEGVPLVPVVVPDVDRAGVLRAAAGAAEVAADVLVPLAECPAVRLLADVPREQARWLAEHLPADRLRVLDLDEEPWTDRQALLVQAEHLLDRPDDAARLAARAAGPLVVRLAAWSLRSAPEGGTAAFPADVGDALDLHAERCGSQELVLRRLLAPLALTGTGAALPSALWAPLASAVAGRDAGALLAGGRALLAPFVEPAGRAEEPGVRLVHPAVADEVRERFGTTVREVQRRIATALVATLPGTDAGPSRWASAPAYVREQLVGHALEGGVLPELLADPGFLLHTDQVRLRTAAEQLAADGVALPALARTWLRLAPVFTRNRPDTVLRAALLEHACRQDGLPVPDFGLDLPWETLWARPLPGARAVTFASTADGTPVVAAAGAEPGLVAYDVRTGEPVAADPQALLPATDEQRAACPVRLGVGGDYVRIWPRDGGAPLAAFVSPQPLGGADVTPDGLLLLADARGVAALRLAVPVPG
ncbi:hypothetical protein KNE206_65900 [Kitasatospora sp. NE20-6]|uniref:ATP-binding protein n=1 Tax=Kitasatospora sp. NE20-6 TaxID=2859066 RepID=UPI0034DBBEF1